MGVFSRESLPQGLVGGERRRRLWETLENPGGSRVGKLFALTSVVFIVVSLVGLVLGSIPELQVLYPNQPLSSTVSEVINLCRE